MGKTRHHLWEMRSPQGLIRNERAKHTLLQKVALLKLRYKLIIVVGAEIYAFKNFDTNEKADAWIYRIRADK